jgi:hypothetical protein
LKISEGVENQQPRQQGLFPRGKKIIQNFRRGYKNLNISEGVKNQQPRQQCLFLRGKKIIQNFRGEKKNFKISEGVFRDGTLPTSISEGLEKNRKFPRGVHEK